METYGTEHMDPDEFVDEFHRAKPGDWIIYAIGHIYHSVETAKDHRHTKALRLVRDQAWSYHEAQEAILVQRRNDEHKYEYIAVKLNGRRRIRPKAGERGRGNPADGAGQGRPRPAEPGRPNLEAAVEQQS